VPSLAELTSAALIFPDLEASTGEGVLRELAERLASRSLVRDAEGLFARLWERERLGSTAIGHGVAIPHCKLDPLARVLVAVAISRQGVEYGAADGAPVRLFFLVVSPSRSPAEHLQSLAAISKWVRSGGDVGGLLAGQDASEIYRLIRGETADHQPTG
jgi:mannitol/fructose-specific phosphotransferase system IIA component (Ntr-type)